MTRFNFLSLLSQQTNGVKQKLAYMVMIGVLASTGVGVAQAAPQSNTDKTIEVTQPLQITKEEIAVIQVLSEVCPPLLDKQQNQKFRQGYTAYLASMLPEFDQPAAVLQYLSEQADYRKILADTRQQTVLFSVEDNRAVCVELTNYQ